MFNSGEEDDPEDDSKDEVMYPGPHTAEDFADVEDSEPE